MEILISGHCVKIDDEDAERVMSKKWYVQAERAASGDTTHRVYDTTKRKLPMTRFILGTERVPGLFIDHINGDKLDNRKANLRVVTNSQNQMNRKVSVTNKLGLKGVRRITSSDRYQASITKDGKLHVLGHFNNPRSAAIAYDNAAREMFGTYALLNFPEVFEPTPNEDFSTESGEKWVRPKGRGYIVSIKASSRVTGYHSKTFLDLYEAVRHRDAFLLLTSDFPRDGRQYSHATLPGDILDKLYVYEGLPSGTVNKLYKENP